VAAEYLNLNAIVLSLVWIVIGLLAYWARQSHRPTGRGWPLVYGLVGAPMLILVAWDYIKAGEGARLEIARRSRARKGGAATASVTPTTGASRPPKARPRKKGPRHR
jgi:hypothetical protein